MPDENDFRWMKNRIYKTNIMIKVVPFLICFPLVIFFIDYYKKYSSPPPPEPIYSVIMTIFLIIAILLLLLGVIFNILAAPTYIKITNEGIGLRYAFKKKNKTIFWNQILKIWGVSLRQLILHPEVAKEAHEIMGWKGVPAINTVIFLKDGKKIKLLLDKKLQKLLMQAMEDLESGTGPRPPPTDENRKDVGFLKKPRKIRIAQK